MHPSIESQHAIDCRTLSATNLRRKYKAEANSHRNMLQRAPKRGNTVHDDFQSFRSFLMRVGPSPCKGASLDRINNDDLEYAPGKVRWADKRTQNSNKRDTLIFHSLRTKQEFTCSRLAKVQKIAPGTIRQRFRRGWTDEEIIAGKRQRISADLARPATSFARRHSGRRFELKEHEKTCREVLWERNDYYAKWYRENEGEEYCLADIETLNERAAEVGLIVSHDAYKRHFAKWWAKWKPHLKRNNLPGWAKELIAEIEGYSLPEKANRKDDLRGLL